MIVKYLHSDIFDTLPMITHVECHIDADITVINRFDCKDLLHRKK